MEVQVLQKTEAARRIGISRVTLDAWVRQGRLHVNERNRVILDRAFLDILESRQERPQAVQNAIDAIEQVALPDEITNEFIEKEVRKAIVYALRTDPIRAIAQATAFLKLVDSRYVDRKANTLTQGVIEEMWKAWAGEPPREGDNE